MTAERRRLERCPREHCRGVLWPEYDVTTRQTTWACGLCARVLDAPAPQPWVPHQTLPRMVGGGKGPR